MRWSEHVAKKDHADRTPEERLLTDIRFADTTYQTSH
jgi:hypothetical protein